MTMESEEPKGEGHETKTTPEKTAQEQETIRRY